MSYNTAKRAAWARIKAEAPELAETLVQLKPFDYQLLDVEIRGEKVWHVDEEPLESMPARKWADFGRPMASGRGAR